METAVKPKTIYHYTTMDGLKGILENKSLWATKIHYLRKRAKEKISIKKSRKCSLILILGET